MTWEKTIGRVSFINCEPLFHGLEESWNVLPAPPSWLTGHLMRRDCILAPIPAADYAKNSDKLVLVPDLSISSKGEVGSVLLFGMKEIATMESIALPSDSATSVTLLKFLIKHRKLDPKYIEMGPDLMGMLDKCDGCLLIGDRALEAARDYPELVRMDLGKEWKEVSGHPMVFGVFAARKDSDVNSVKSAYTALIQRLIDFETNSSVREEVIKTSSQKSSQSIERLERYFGEVINRMDPEDMTGLEQFLNNACQMQDKVKMAW
jgi:chorismate dehydratase|tara:strand:- start:536 stop:1324 length:789 start_codon:yes stop_codon:yes gene_type:complete